MADYKAIQGYTVEKLSSDPSPVIAGKLYYNDTSNVFKIGVSGDSAWATAGTLNTGRRDAAGSGLQTAALIIGGKASGSTSPTSSDITESYDGTTWTEVGDLNTVRSQLFSGGTQTATIGGGGYDGATTYDVTEIWNGASWTTNPATQGIARYGRGYSGNSTDGICIGGGHPWTALCESWDGTSWTERADLNTARSQLSAAGASSTSALTFAGAEANPSPPPGSKVTALCESWNGTAWTEVNNTNHTGWAAAGWGIQTAAMHAGGYPATAATELWNGTSWTAVASMGTARYAMADNIGTQALGLVGGAGSPDPYPDTTEAWNQSPIAAETVTTS